MVIGLIGNFNCFASLYETIYTTAPESTKASTRRFPTLTEI